MLKVGELIQMLSEFDRDAHVMFSTEDINDEDPERRLFSDDVESIFSDGHSVTVKLLAEDNQR